MELALEFVLVIYYIFDVGVDVFRHIGELLLAPAHEYVVGFDLIAFGHDVEAGVVLGQQEVLDGEEYDDVKEEYLGLVLRIHIPGINHIS